MRGLIRSVGLAVSLGATALCPVFGQVQVEPRNISFVATGYTQIPSDRPPGRFTSVFPASPSVEVAAFQVIIRPINLPSGEATNFVIVSPSSGVAATELSGVPRVRPIIALNPKVVPYMRPGSYSLDVVFSNPVHPELPAGTVHVNLRLTSPGLPVAGAVVHSASMQPGISPGQATSIFGTNLSSPPITAEADSLGRFPTVIGHTRVTVDGTAAPLLYVSNDRIDFVAPQGIAGRSSVQVVVDLLSPSGLVFSSPPVTVPVADVSPGIFTADSSGSGPGAIENTSAGTGPNREDNPAPKGSTITFHATGTGAWNAPFADGSLVISPSLGLAPPSPVYLAPAAPVSVSIGGQPAKLIWVWGQPMRVLGLLEVVVEIPEGIDSGAQPIVLKIGENDNARQNVTVWVQ